MLSSNGGHSALMKAGSSWALAEIMVTAGSYHGYVMAVPESGRGRTIVYQVPTANQCAIWGPAGMSIKSDGDIYVATGNGSSRSAFDMGNAVIRLSSTLHVRSWFAPANWEPDNVSDLDLGSTAPMLLPRNRLFEVGKDQVGYLLNAKRLGGIGGSIQSISVCNARGGDAYADGFLYLPCPDSGMVALRLLGGHLSIAWHVSSALGSPTVGRTSYRASRRRKSHRSLADLRPNGSTGCHCGICDNGSFRQLLRSRMVSSSSVDRTRWSPTAGNSTTICRNHWGNLASHRGELLKAW